MVNGLQELVIERLSELGSPQRPLSYRAAAARSQGRVSHGTIGRIARGGHPGVLEEATLSGLALALDVPRARIELAAGIYRDQPAEPFVLPPRANRLTRRERAVVLSMIDALIAASEQGREPAHVSNPTFDGRTAETQVPASADYDLVAYAPDGSGALSDADMETIRRHEEKKRTQN